MLIRPVEASFSKTLPCLELPAAKLDAVPPAEKLEVELPEVMLELVLFNTGEGAASAIS